MAKRPAGCAYNFTVSMLEVVCKSLLPSFSVQTRVAMNLSGLGAAVLGILLGVALTLQLYRLFSTHTTQFGNAREMSKHSNLTHTIATSDVNGRLDKLKLEQADLIAKLRRVESEIAHFRRAFLRF